MSDDLKPLSAAELAEEGGTALPDKEVVSILDLNADLDIALDVAAPIDLAVAANANVAAPIDAAVGGNILSVGSEAQALADQGVMVTQGVTGDATATSVQDSGITTTDSTAAPAAATDPAAATTAPTGLAADTSLPDGTVPTDGTLPTEGLPTGGLPTDGLGAGALPTDLSGALDGNLLNVNVDLAADADLTAPVNGAVAANANVAAPIDAAVAANIGSVDSDAVAIAQQDAIIEQQIVGDATAGADQTSDVETSDSPNP